MVSRPDSGVGAGFVGRVSSIVLATLLVAAAALALIVLVQLWPSPVVVTAGKVVPPDHHALLTYRFAVSADVNLILLVAVAGALGGIVHSLRSVAWYMGNRTLVWSWVAFYALIPPTSAVLAVIFYMVYRAGLVSTQSNDSLVSPYGAAAIAALVGLFSGQAAEKLKQVFETLLAKAPTGNDHTAPSPPTVTTLTPSHGAVGTPVIITGTGLAGPTSMKFGDVPAQPSPGGTDDRLVLTVPVGAVSGPITITTSRGAVATPSFTVDASPTS